jgi:hypothetical protein
MASSDPDTPRGPIQGLQDLAKSMGGDPSQPQMSTFLRGLVLGAFVGAAVAGSTIWRRRRDQAAKLRAMSPGPVAGIAPQAEPSEADQNRERSTSSTSTASPPRIGPETSGGGSGEPAASPDER